MSGLVVRVRRDAAPEVLRVSTVSSPAGAASGGLDGPAMGELTEGVRVVAIRRAGGPCYSTPRPTRLSRPDEAYLVGLARWCGPTPAPHERAADVPWRRGQVPS